MTVKNFTPGPWEASACFERKRGDSYVVLAHDGIKVAECWVDAPGNDHEARKATEADARLIAAAPEMYEALKACLGSFELAHSHKKIAAAADGGIVCACDLARAALAKAAAP